MTAFLISMAVGTPLFLSLAAWMRHAREPAIGWWLCAWLLVFASAAGSFVVDRSSPWPGLGEVFGTLSAWCFLLGARAFVGRRFAWWIVAAALVLGLTRGAAHALAPDFSVWLATVIGGPVVIAAAVTLWRAERPADALARPLAVAMLGLGGMTMLDPWLRNPTGYGSDVMIAWSGTSISVIVLQIAAAAHRVRLRQEQRLADAARREAMRTLSGGVAHHLNNQLTVLLGGIELLRAEPWPDHVAALFGDMDAAAHRCAELVRDLQVEDGGSSPVGLGEVRASLERTSRLLQRFEPVAVETRVVFDDRSGAVPISSQELHALLLALASRPTPRSPGGLGAPVRIDAGTVDLPQEALPELPQLRAGRFLRVAILGGRAEPEGFEGGLLTSAERTVREHGGWLEIPKAPKTRSGADQPVALFLPVDVDVAGSVDLGRVARA